MIKKFLILSLLVAITFNAKAQSDYYEYDDNDGGYENTGVYEIEDDVYDSYEVRIKRFHHPKTVIRKTYYDGLFTIGAAAAIITVAATPYYWHPLYYSWYRPVVYHRYYTNCVRHSYYRYSYYRPGVVVWHDYGYRPVHTVYHYDYYYRPVVYHSSPYRYHYSYSYVYHHQPIHG